MAVIIQVSFKLFSEAIFTEYRISSTALNFVCVMLLKRSTNARHYRTTYSHYCDVLPGICARLA